MIFTDPSWSWTNKKEAENRRSEIFKWASHLKNEWDREKFKKNIRDCYSSCAKHIDRDLSQDVLDLKNKLCP